MLDIVFYKVLIALEMLLPVDLCVDWRDARADVYRLEITAISAAGGSPGRLYKAVLYLAIPLKCFHHPSVDVWSSVGLYADLSTEAAVAVGTGCSPVAGKNLTLTITDE